MRYEIGLSVLTGSIIWVNGPFPCGKYPDLKIFKSDMLKSLNDGEYVIADNGYPHNRCITADNVEEDFSEIHSRIRARHETVNKRLKQFDVLKFEFRHSLNKHCICFHAVSELTAISLDSSEPLFDL